MSMFLVCLHCVYGSASVYVGAVGCFPPCTRMACQQNVQPGRSSREAQGMGKCREFAAG